MGSVHLRMRFLVEVPDQNANLVPALHIKRVRIRSVRIDNGRLLPLALIDGQKPIVSGDVENKLLVCLSWAPCQRGPCSQCPLAPTPQHTHWIHGLCAVRVGRRDVGCVSDHQYKHRATNMDVAAGLAISAKISA